MSSAEVPTLPPTRAERRAARKAGQAQPRFTTRKVILWSLGIQIALAALLMGRDLATALPHIAWPSTKPSFDTPILPGDQTRRFRPGDTPLRPADQGNPDRPFRTTGDMPARLTLSREGETATLTGQIAPGDADRILEQLDSQTIKVTRLRLNSPGGSVSDALQLGRAIREDQIDTLLGAGDICLSACPYMLAAGTERRVHDSAQVGVHQHYFGTNSALPAFLAVEDIQRGQGEVMAYLDDMGVDPLIMRHALATPPDEIYVLLPDQLAEYRMVTD